MSYFYAPPMTRVPEGATYAIRERMYREHIAEIVHCNPQYFLPPGVKKRWWHFFKIEYPKVLLTT